MRIVLDGMGSDDHPKPEIEAAERMLSTWEEDTLILAGRTSILRGALPESLLDHPRLVLQEAPQVLEMTDEPAQAAKNKPDSSMAVGMRLLKTGDAEAFVTAGNTGGAMANALFQLGRIRGVKRPALSPTFPVRDGHAIMIDVGANADCKPEYFLQFGIMGSLYAEVMYGIENPRVALLSNGEEPGKGNLLVKESYPLLQRSGLNFIGNVEPKEFFAGSADVTIADGFTGNVFLKTSEAVSKLLVDIMRQEIRSNPVTTLGGMLARPAFREVARIMDPSEYGAVPLLGVNGLVFIGHGRSDGKALYNALKVARKAVEGGLLEAMRTGLRERL